MEERLYKVNLKDANQRLDMYVASLDVRFTRSMAQKKIKNGTITVNNKIQKESYNVKENDEIKIVKEYGFNKLNEIAKLNFKNVEKIKSGLK